MSKKSNESGQAARLRAAYQAGWNAAVLHLQGVNMRVVQDFSTEQMREGEVLARLVYPDVDKKKDEDES